MENSVEKILILVDNSARTLVGVMLKRLELLEKEDSLNPSLYKALLRERVYEESRNLKTLIKVYMEMPKIEFKTKPNEEKQSLR